ncbi:probable G-protein coupled receptor 83 [Trichonephila inaurata madagascariensis]|uniref:Probable G-protein coupled receptor 83 n=1 Tax=Trichonephila inaurata madagascariensis TaxID=2747483 RepID=A0A8X6YUZ7_9ARAC|nr:probable G-protein coupled receptor 83 [Trichonephila inaurata madagascariensis]
MSVQNILAQIKLLRLGLNHNSNKSSNLWIDENANLNMTSNENSTYQEMIIENWLQKYSHKLSENAELVRAVVIFFYALIVLVSFFGNSIVCKIVFSKSSIKSATNVYIGNLSISDLMMTVINIPLQLTEVLLRNWPLGSVLCKCLPFFGTMSVSVSTLTMAFIALDRYQIIAHPMKPKESLKTTIRKILLIWIMAVILSFPYPLMSNVVRNVNNDYMTRCTIIYPPPDVQFRQIFTLIALFLQFIAPLTVSGVTYVKISLIIWKRKCIGEVTLNQKQYHRHSKWKTIKMLIVVLVVFVVCWLPLNIYHTYQDSRGEIGVVKHRSVVWFVCHWFAMSSVCCNPFIYCWLNEKFRNVAKDHLKWIFTFGKLKPLKTIINLFRKENKILTFSRIKTPPLKFFSFSTYSKQSSTHFSEFELETLPQMTGKVEGSKQNCIHMINTAIKITGETSVSIEKSSSEKVSSPENFI